MISRTVNISSGKSFSCHSNTETSADYCYCSPHLDMAVGARASRGVPVYSQLSLALIT